LAAEADGDDGADIGDFHENLQGMLCTDPEDNESLMYGAQLKLLPGKKIELILEPMDQK
jgi:hypothetical protein